MVRHCVPPTTVRPKGKFTSYARTLDSNQEPVDDDGRIPGDGRGAGGYDSSFYRYSAENLATVSVLDKLSGRFAVL